MSRIIGGGLVALALAGSVLAAPAGVAYADAGCVAVPADGVKAAPVFAAPSTESAQINEITYSHPGRGCGGGSNLPEGVPYEICGGGIAWQFINSMSGYTPWKCIDFYW